MVSELKWDPENLEVQNLKIIGKHFVLKVNIYHKVHFFGIPSEVIFFGVKNFFLFFYKSDPPVKNMLAHDQIQ